MSTFLIYTVVATLAALVPWLHFKRAEQTSSKVLAIVLTANFIVGWLGGYLLTPFFYGPFFGMTLTVLVFGAVNAIVACTVKETFETFTHGTFAVSGVAIIFLITAIAGSPMFRASEYRDLLGTIEERTWEQDETPVDLTHIRVVSKEQAEWLGNKVIGEAPGSLGSRYELGEYHIQRVHGELYWVAPLEFRGLFKWWGFGHSVGYVMVSAEDRTRQPQLVTNHKLRYMPSAFFGDNLTRYLYTHGYARKGLTEYTFELDEDLNPRWVVTVFRPSITYFGPVVEGVVVVNPETGETQYHAAGEVPEWVDRVYPEEFVESYLTWSGKYVQGWLNSWISEENVEAPTPYGRDSNDVFLVWGSQDGQPYWFTGFTSASSVDQSLTGLVLVNSRTGQARRYRATGPNEEGVLQAVNNAISNYEGWRGTQPILYNVGGEKTWVVPVIGGNNILQRIAMVRLSNAMVSLGTDTYEALRNYRAMLARSGFSVAPAAGSSQVEKAGLALSRMSTEIADGKTLYYLYFDELPNQVFIATSDISPELPITRVGEKVTIRYIETSEPVVQINMFDNEALQIRLLDEQRGLDERRATK